MIEVSQLLDRFFAELGSFCVDDHERALFALEIESLTREQLLDLATRRSVEMLREYAFTRWPLMLSLN
jgi:hypothetical protein